MRLHRTNVRRFGALQLHAVLQVGKDQLSWQQLDCYLFTEMLICVKEKRTAKNTGPSPRFTLKGSIMIKKHLRQVELSPHHTLTLSLQLLVAELPAFFLQFEDEETLSTWQRVLLLLRSDVNSDGRQGDFHTGEETSALLSAKSSATALASAEYVEAAKSRSIASDLSLPIDLVIVIPLSSSMHGIKTTLLRDTLRFVVQNLGPRDRLGLVAFGSGSAQALATLNSGSWRGWPGVIDSVRPNNQRSLRADLAEGAAVALDLLTQRQVGNPIASIFVVSDVANSEQETVEVVAARSEQARSVAERAVDILILTLS
ncbi:hypothetical protein MRB53_038185 [Persea americana]|nr:hypothetical protein MRB53_038185 [Persea americana]